MKAICKKNHGFTMEPHEVGVRVLAAILVFFILTTLFSGAGGAFLYLVKNPPSLFLTGTENPLTASTP
ncbi:MAG TPA: hypothetical protein ENN13_05350, partial [Candidatus Altiarchaeales archaeon]|nr:hypothetical protein [Candidatus Altiarchaeales archaeon]